MTKYFNRKSKFKTAFIAALTAVTVSCTCLASACEKTPSDEDETTSVKREDAVQLLKNGDFEFFDYPDKAVYLIKTADNWTRGGDSAYSMSGIIGTSPAAWKLLADEQLADKLDANNELDASDENYEDEYVDYNGMRSRDVLYRDSYAALLEDDKVSDSYIKNQSFAKYFGITRDDSDSQNVKYYLGETQVYLSDSTSADEWEDGEYFFDAEFTKPVRKAIIDNPSTHYNLDEDSDGLYFLNEKNEKVRVYEDERYLNEKGEKVGGDYFYYVDGDKTNDKDENKQYISNVLMVHNYNTNYNGISQYYSSQTLTLEANTAAEISLWVKTSDLKFDKGYSLLTDQDRGAFIEVKQTVNGTSLDSTVIKAINTEKIIADNESLNTNNGWLKYTIYVNACTFGSSTIQLSLGLGQDATDEKCTGYAFFDDVTVTKYKTIDETGYNESAGYPTSTLTDEGNDNVFIADKDIRGVSGTVGNKRYSENFEYFIDLASATDENDNYMEFAPLIFGANSGSNSNSVTVGLTTETSKNYVGTEKIYAAATTNGAAINAPSGANLTTATVPAGGYSLPDGLNGAAVDTKNDLLGIFAADAAFSFGSGLIDYSLLLKTALVDNGITGLPQYKNNNMLLLFSAAGASYTATIEADNAFTLEADEYKLVSFWIKTAEMNGNTAAVAKVYFDDDNSTSISIDTTNTTTDIGDSEEDKDIYKGWVQCFFFVHNDADEQKTFKIDFGFGTTSVASATSSSFNYGWSAMANMQTLDINEKVYDLASDGDYCKKFSFSGKEDEKEGNYFDEASSTSNIKTEIADSKNYSGVNGGSSIVADNEYKNEFDKADTNAFAGLVNQKYIGDFDNNVLSSFISGATNWNQVFGSDCYQPLIIINNLRYYASSKTADEETYKQYWVLDDEALSTDDTLEFNGKTYRKVREDEEFDENQTYYSNFDLVANYGFIGSSQSISSSSYKTVSVKVMVTGNATAYIYLVDDSTKDVLEYNTPEYSFYYDDEGNVLKEKYSDKWSDEEHKANIVYYVREDGLYSENIDGSGDLYANLYNLNATYQHYRFKRDADGNVSRYYRNDGNEVVRVYFDDLEDNVEYFIDESCTIKAPHFLSSSDGTRIYEYKNGTDGKYEEGYYYIYYGTDKDGNVTESLSNNGKSLLVNAFNQAYRRPVTESTENYEYFVEVPNTQGKWVTVSFFIKTGSEDKSYRLELWSGKRDETGTDETGNYAQGAVAFDYSYESDITESEFTSRVNEYESNIVRKYVDLLEVNGLLGELKSTSENISYYENFIDELDEDTANYAAIVAGKEDIQESYRALYYAYSLYDSENYVPFNAITADEGETGYEYTASDYDDTLAYLRYDSNNSLNVFIDYSAVDKSFTIGTSTTTPDDGDTSDNESSGEEIWLYIASIILVVAMLFTLVSLIVRDALKKVRRKKGVKNQSKNVYRKRERYIRKLHLVKTEEAPEENIEEHPEEEQYEVTEETEAVNESEELPEETPAEEVIKEDAPVEEQATETPAEEEVNPDGEDNKE